MAHDHHDHLEPEQNEIGGPVVFALFLFAIVVVAIGMMASVSPAYSPFPADDTNVISSTR